jgi:hypothetical protein
MRHFVMLEKCRPLAEAVECVQKDYHQRVAVAETRLQKQSDEAFAERMQQLNLMQALSDLVKMFPFKSKAYYYSYGGYDRQDDIENCVSSFEVGEVIYTPWDVKIAHSDGPSFTVCHRDSNLPTNRAAYPTKEACIEAHRAAHETSVAATAKRRQAEEEVTKSRMIEQAKKLLGV